MITVKLETLKVALKEARNSINTLSYDPTLNKAFHLGVDKLLISILSNMVDRGDLNKATEDELQKYREWYNEELKERV